MMYGGEYMKKRKGNGYNGESMHEQHEDETECVAEYGAPDRTGVLSKILYTDPKTAGGK